MLKDFKAFIARGNVLDLAVGVIIGGAFATITKSLTEDLLMPLLGWLFGGFDFSSHFVRLGAIPASYHGSANDYAALKAAGVPLFGYGQFLTAVINFVILAFMVFLIVRGLAKVSALAEHEQPAAEAAPAPETDEVKLLREIRDALTSRG
ncbi:large conductance mechanosensitive channel protein MscL [Sphingomonas sp.]|uniref:large conductance mechanosensitive channel protein MscL n=1 Tax=Sphingomonas sp. TaxID=28214 RepID=UPI001B2C04BF|nr:large conductance mechanosensitive channel protein MscL [Sphingomonas sp.]MBO9714210.1 large conductance mechanosensitive channel protein MscL [Sphingomonas sp.]